ncbi:MAG: helix-turn-helix domain-containing protein [Fidelibacterota bacterium]|nr:MAG: helix-turn-helix domain-containing protein [Candidatus Neomarinimicrobiota bacterium]
MEQAETFYHELKQLRVAQGISLEDISARTRINIRFLEALERGELEILPKTYMRLFLRSYCREIGADVKEAIQQIEEHLGGPKVPHATLLEEFSASLPSPTKSDSIPETESRGPVRLRRDLFAGAGIFLLLIIVTFFARRVYQEPAASESSNTIPPAVTVEEPRASTTSQSQPDASRTEVPTTRITEEESRPVTTQPPATRIQPIVPEESAVELPDELFTQERIVSHHMERIRLTPPVRLTLMARDNVVIQPLTDGQQGTAFNLTVAEVRIWTIQEELIIRTTAIELLRGDLNGVPINLGQTRGIGVLRVTPSGEYEVFAYANISP